MQYLYEIAGIRVLYEIPFQVTVQAESENFIMPLSNKMAVDIVYVLQPVESMKIYSDSGHWEICRYCVEENGSHDFFYCITPQGIPYACVKWPDILEGKIIVNYVKGMGSYLNYSHNICDILSLETLLLHYNGFILHSSFIRWQQQGILFSAPSGTGKSTQADLWVEYEGAEIINGDRAGLRLIDGVWQAYGLPYAGSSHIYRNENAPVAAVVVLRQAKENRIRRLRAAEAIRFLYPEVTAHHWDREFVDRILNLLMELTEAVPVYLLECLPDRGAVELVKDTIFYANLPASE